MTCGPLCRVSRRRRVRRRRRALDIHEFRVDERLRQRACRARKRAGSNPVSRPGLLAQLPDLQRELLEIVDRHTEVSRAGLRREVSRLLRVRAGNLGQAEHAGP
jgi:septum formation topological specificity factor MinE